MTRYLLDTLVAASVRANACIVLTDDERDVVDVEFVLCLSAPLVTSING